MSQKLAAAPRVPFPMPPARGQALAVAPGVLWLQFALPLKLNHVNVYLVEDGEGWLLVDTGAGDPATAMAWVALLEADADGPLRGRPITRIFVTHHHPDHVGGAAALVARTGAAFLMGETEALTARLYRAEDESAAARLAFYKRHGLGPDKLDAVGGHLQRYRVLVPGLPPTFAAVRAGDVLTAGDRRLDVLEMPGHAAAQMILHDRANAILFAADHVMTRITPNISVSARNPDDDPLARYLASLAVLRDTVPDGTLVLPGHHLPFRHLHARTLEIEAHHADRCAAIEAACATAKGRTVADLVPLLFPFELDAHQFWFAFSEILAHLNFLGRQGRLEARVSHGRCRWGTVGRPSHMTVCIRDQTPICP